MTKPIKAQQPKSHQARPAPKADAASQQEKAESAEVLGRHKNTGQKDHKGAR